MRLTRVLCAVLLLHVAYAATKVHVRGHSVNERSDWSSESTGVDPPPPPPPANDEWSSDSTWTYPPTNGDGKNGDSTWTYPPTNGGDKNGDSTWTYPPTNDASWTDPPTNDKTADATWTYPPTNDKTSWTNDASWTDPPTNDKTNDATWTYPPTNDASWTDPPTNDKTGDAAWTDPPTSDTDSTEPPSADATEPPKDGTEDSTEPPADDSPDSTEQPTEPPTDDSPDPTEQPTDDSPDSTEPPTDDSPDSTEQPTDDSPDSTEQPTEPPTDDSPDSTEPPTDDSPDSTEQPTEPPGSSSEDSTEQPTEPPGSSSEDSTEQPTEPPGSSEDSTEQPTEPPGSSSEDSTEQPTEPPTDGPSDSTEQPTEPPGSSSEDSTEPPTDGDGTTEPPAEDSTTEPPAEDSTTEPPTEDSTTEPPTTEPPTTPPSTTSAPTCVLTTLTYSSAKTPKYFLNGVAGSVTFTAAYTGDPNTLQFVEFKVGTKSVGKVTPDKAKDGSFALVYKVTAALESPEVTATPTLKSGDTGPAVKVSLPLLEVPQWVLNFLWAPEAKTLGSFDKWQRSFSHSLGFSHNSSSKFNVPFIGFATFTGWNLNYYATIANTGVASAGGTGNVDFKVDSNLIPLFSGAAFSTGLSANIITEAQPNGIYTLTFDSFGISAMGTIKLKVPLSFKKGFTVGAYEFTASITVPVSFKLGIELTYALDQQNKLFGLPLSFRGITGSLTATAGVQGSVKVFTSSAALYGSVGITPKIGWHAQNGFQFEGVTISVSVQVDIELAGVKMPSISILAINPKYFSDGARKRDEPKIDESEIVTRQDVTLESYVNVWSPTIKSKEPLVITNAYPSKQLALAEASGVQLIAFSSFDETQEAPGDQQVEFAWRNASAGGSWSALLFATASASLPVANPAVAGLADGSGVLVVAIQNTNPAAALEAMTMRLVACTFDVRIHLFSAWQAVAAPTDATTVYSDWMPELSTNSLGLMWKRVTLTTDADGTTTTSTALLFSRYSSPGFSAPMTVLSGDAAKALSAFSMDADDAGGAVMAYVAGDDSSVMVCTLKGGASAWKCLGTRLGFTDDSGGSVVVSYAPAGTPSNFAIAFNRETTLYAVRISSSGVLASALWTSDLMIYPASMAISECELLGEPGSAVVSFTTTDVDGAGFGYAVIAPDGSIHSSPSAWLNASASGMGAGTPQSLATLCARSSLYFAASVRDDSGANSVGTMTVTELPYEADAALYPLVFSPANFDIPAGGAVRVSVGVVNRGMQEYPAGRTVQFVLSSGSGKSSETQIGTAKTTVALQSGDETTVSIMWTPTGKTGVLIARLTSADANSTNNVVSADPCSVSVGVPQLVVSASTVAIKVDMSVQGYCSATYPLIATARPARSVDLLGTDLREMQKEIGRTQFTLTNQEWRSVTIPVTSMADLDSIVSVSLTGVSGARAHAEAQLPQDLYDFYFDAEDIAMKQVATGGVNVRITLGNRGLRAAPAVSVRAWLTFEDGTQRKLAEKKVEIGALARKYVRLLLPLSAKINSVAFTVNEDKAYPEVYVLNNNLTHTIEVVGGAINGGWATGTAGPAPAPTAGSAAGAGAGSGSGAGPAPSPATSSSGKSSGPAPVPPPNAAGSKSGGAASSSASSPASSSASPSTSSSSSGVALHHGALIGVSVVAGVLLIALAGGVVAYALYTRNRDDRLAALGRQNNDGL